MPTWSLPLRVAIVDKAGRLPAIWRRIFETFTMAAVVRGVVDVSQRAAAVATTTMATPILTAGLYRLSWYVRVQVAAGVSSAVQATLGWTDGGVAQTWSGALVNGNLTTSGDADAILVRMDAGGGPTFAASYASNPAGAMRYRLNVVLEEVPLPSGASAV